MEGYLTKNQIEYVFYHLSIDGYKINYDKREFYFLKKNDDLNKYGEGIIFLLSPEPLIFKNVKWIDDIPVLFPLSDKQKFYSIINSCLIFHHDLLKSAFYLLSGYQEYYSNKRDQLNRYLFSESIQNKLDITHLPLVNYYFKKIKDGIEKYYSIEHINLAHEINCDKFGLLLTHDIDRVTFYDIHRVKLLIKKLLGLKQSSETKFFLLQSLVDSLFQYLNVFKRNNPYWNFEYLRALERKYNYKSVFYFLHSDQLHVDSYYSFSDKHVKELIHWLEKEKCEIGIHGTVASATNLENSKRYLNKLEKISNNKILGIRQHRLTYEHTITTRIHDQLGLMYDSTLGFAEHEGFRNSFCLPFKLYDFENDCMFNVFEIPLNIMDVTLFHYRNLDLSSAKKVVMKILNEIKNFNGIMTILWHNTFFNEHRIPGITKFYEDLLRTMNDESAVSLRGKDIVNKLDKIESLKKYD